MPAAPPSAEALPRAAEPKRPFRRVVEGLTRRVVVVRIVFGAVWAIDAFYKWRPGFVDDYAKEVGSAAQGQPDTLRPWFHFWRHLVVQDPRFFAYATAVFETLIALALLGGVARRAVYVLGAVWSLALWTVPEGFGGSFLPDATDVGTGIVYVLVFAALYSLETLTSNTWSLDRRIERRVSWWRAIAEPGGRVTGRPA